MRFWWVNQNQTFAQETQGGYMWSPKRNADGHRNPFYEFMREAAPGDMVFSFARKVIPSIGVVQSFAYAAPRPTEFGNAGPNWSSIGWRVDVQYRFLDHQITPADNMESIGPWLPNRYSPLSANGRGRQGVYLTLIPPALANVLIRLIGTEAIELQNMLGDDPEIARDVAVGLAEWEEHLSQQVAEDLTINDTQRLAIVLARRGQGRFKEAVMLVEQGCRITGVTRIEHLRASHIKPWRDCESYEERLDGHNGFLMTPSVDHLFDRGFISFENDGELLVAPIAHRDSLNRMGIETEQRRRVGQFNEEQRHYLEFHRDRVFLHAQVNMG